MGLLENDDNIKELVDGLNFKQKIERSLALIDEAYTRYGDGLVVANSLGKDSVCVWDLAKKVNPKISGFIVTTRYKPEETVRFMYELIEEYPELRVFKNDQEIPDKLYVYDPDQCCFLLKVLPTRWAIEQMDVTCWVTGLRCTEGRTRTDYREVEERDEGLIKLNPLYAQGYRSLGCAPCTRITSEEDERAGRWLGTSKCGGECGIHTRPLKGEPALR
jgi:phosphoadenosine phosphosulfate reductase